MKMSLHDLRNECKNNKLPYSGTRKELSFVLANHLQKKKTEECIKNVDIMLQKRRDEKREEEHRKEYDNFDEDFNVDQDKDSAKDLSNEDEGLLFEKSVKTTFSN